MNNLFNPCKSMLYDKLQITPPDNLIIEAIDNAVKSISNTNYHNQDTTTLNKKILSHVHEQFKNNDTIENAVQQLETIRGLPSIPINSSQSSHTEPTQPTQPIQPIHQIQPIHTYKSFYTHLITLNTSKSIIKLPKNTRCHIHCIHSNIIPEDIITIIISNQNHNYTYHMYKDNTNLYKTIDNLDPIVVSNKDRGASFQIHVQNYKGNDIYIPPQEVTLTQIQQLDTNHFKLITTKDTKQHDIQINQHVFFHVDTNTYITNSTINDLSQFINSKCTILVNNINIFFKYTYLQ